MRAFILCDYEGATGVVSWGDEENTLGPEAMAGDVNATIDGLIQGGFTNLVKTPSKRPEIVAITKTAQANRPNQF